MAGRRALENDLGFLLTRASALLVKDTNDAMAPLGLRVRAYSVLSLVCDDPNGVTQRAVADDVGLDPSQIVALVDDLENRGLVARTADRNDRRNKLVVATDAGRDLCQQAQRRSKDVTARHFAGVDSALLERLRTVLVQVVFPGLDEAAS
jgi:DNA-binding MarR family transcriptional regulator